MAAEPARRGGPPPVVQIMLLGAMGGIQTADPTIASTALVDSARSLGMDAGTQAIAASISTLMLAATVITTGLIADRIGRKLLLVLALLVAAAGDLLTAAAIDPLMFMSGRAVAGIGLGAVFGASFAYVRSIVPERRLPSAMGTFAAFGAVVMIIASFVGGSAATADWRLAFLVIPALSLLSMVGVLVLLPPEPKVASGPADVAGQALLALGIIGVLYGISHAATGIADPLTWAPFVVGLVLLAGFAVVESRGRHPFFPIALFSNPGFIAAIGLGLAVNFGQAVSVLQFANIWQFVYGFTTVQVALAQLPLSIGSVIASVLLGRLLTRGMAPALAIGISGGAMTLGLLSVALTLVTDGFWAFLPGLILVGVGMSGLVPYGALILRLAPPAQFGAVTSSRTTIGQFGFAVGLAASMVMIDALTRGGVVRRLAEAGVPPTRTGQALDAITQYTQTGTVPAADAGGTALLAGAADSYHIAFVTTLAISAVVVAALTSLAVLAHRRWERGLAAAA